MDCTDPPFYVFLQAYPSHPCSEGFLHLPVESAIIFIIFNHCAPNSSLKAVMIPQKEDREFHNDSMYLKNESVIPIDRTKFEHFCDERGVTWDVADGAFPFVLHGDTIISGLCAVARHICKYRTSASFPHEHKDGLLGFRQSCLQAPNEVSVWTKFCEVDILRTLLEHINTTKIDSLPINLVRFENHLAKPVRVHNVYKLAREMNKMSLADLERSYENTGQVPKQDTGMDRQAVNSKQLNGNTIQSNENTEEVPKQDAAMDRRTVHSKKSNENTRQVPKQDSATDSQTNRQPKARKWNSKVKKQQQIDSSIKIEDLEVKHQFAEGPFLTLADLILLTPVNLLSLLLGKHIFQSFLPLTYKWLVRMKEIVPLPISLPEEKYRKLEIEDIISLPTTEDVSLYKCDPKRHNPKKRLFTKEDDIDEALGAITNGMEIDLSNNELELGIDWETVPHVVNPLSGHLPNERMIRKSQQLENLVMAVKSLAKDGDVIVDFCSGCGHLGILLAWLLPKCTIVLLDNKEQSLEFAKRRVHDLKATNVRFIQCNLDFFNGKFDIGVALHACGIASDLVLDKCLKANAKFVICPCCYGSLHATNRLVYPRSKKFAGVTIDQYLCIGHTADQTHKDHPLAVRGARCMAVIDSDRARLAEDYKYKVKLTRLKPLSCTPKNNLIIGTPIGETLLAAG